MAKPSIFISHSHQDYRLAQRVHDLLLDLSKNGLDVHVSSVEGNIKSGENWVDWIDDKIRSCDVAIVLLTPSSFRNQWVLWEAGAVAGVAMRSGGVDASEGDAQRRVRVLQFGLGAQQLGPFRNNQAKDGLKAKSVKRFLRELLTEKRVRNRLDEQIVDDALETVAEHARAFVEGASKDLLHTPLAAREELVQEWLDRLNRKLNEQDYSWVAAADRWIRIAFLGRGAAAKQKSSEDPRDDYIDARLHLALARGFEKSADWKNAVRQLELARVAATNDIVLLTRLGRALRGTQALEEAEGILSELQQLDPGILKIDREAIGFAASLYADQEDWERLSELLKDARRTLVAKDEYLLGWRAIAAVLQGKKDVAESAFKSLARLTHEKGGIWSQSSQVNALLGLGRLEEAAAVLGEMKLKRVDKGTRDSATKYFDTILEFFEHELDWRKAAGLPRKRSKR